MTQSESVQPVTSTDADSSAQKGAETNRQAEQQTTNLQAPSGITSDQAEQIISQLKSLKQNVVILTLVAGFFALRAILFHR